MVPRTLGAEPTVERTSSRYMLTGPIRPGSVGTSTALLHIRKYLPAVAPKRWSSRRIEMNFLGYGHLRVVLRTIVRDPHLVRRGSGYRATISYLSEWKTFQKNELFNSKAWKWKI